MLAIVGLGLISNLGVGCQNNFSCFNSLEGKKRDKFLSNLDFSSMRNSKIESLKGSIVNFNDISLRKLAKINSLSNINSRSALLSIISIKEALFDAKIKNCIENINREKIGLFCGTSQGGTVNLESFYNSYIKNNIIKKNLLWESGYSCINDLVAHKLNIKGPRYCVSTACSSSLALIPIIKTLMDMNVIEVAILYGVDPISELVSAGFYSLKAMALKGARPFNKHEKGMMVGEGSAALIITKKKVEKVYGYILGTGSTSDAFHITSPHPTAQGTRKSIQLALENSNLNMGQIDLISTHGSSTEANDKSEALALQKIFGETPEKQPDIFGCKGIFGHTLGAAGVFNMVISTLALFHNISPLTPGFIETDRNINISNKSKRKKISNVLVNAFGFGGNNVSTIISKKYLDSKISYDNKVFISGLNFINETGEDSEMISNQIFLNKEPNVINTGTVSFTGDKTSMGAAVINHKNFEEIEKKLKSYSSFNKMDRISKITLYSNLKLLDKLDIKISNKNADSMGMFWSSGTGPMNSIYDFYHKLVSNGFDTAEAKLFPNCTMVSSIGHTTIELGLKGSSMFFANTDLSSGDALRAGKNILMDESSKISNLICGGSDEYSEIIEKGYLEIDHLKYFQNKNKERYFLGEGSFSVMLSKESSLEGRKNLSTLIEYEFSTQVSIFNSGANRYKKDFLFQYKHQKIIEDKFFPDLIIANYKGLEEHDKILDTFIIKFFPGIKVYKPYKNFGYYIGLSTVASVIYSKAFLEADKDLLSKLYIRQPIKRIIILTLSSGGCLGIDVLRRV
tara:strand:- start:5336 stop:7726 length:2391 start_codon:yes stop_codon:yes gene_type:complete